MVPTPCMRLIGAKRGHGTAWGDHHHRRFGAKSPYGPNVWGRLSQTSRLRCPPSYAGKGKGLGSRTEDKIGGQGFLARTYKGANPPWEMVIFELGLATILPDSPRI